MRTALAMATGLSLALLSTQAAALGPVIFTKGVVRLIDGAKETGGRSVWARGQSLVVTWNGAPVQAQVLRTQDAIVREVRLASKGNRNDLEIRLTGPAERYLPGLLIQTQGGDLLVKLAPADAATAATPASSSEAAETAAPATATSSTAGSPRAGTAPTGADRTRADRVESASALATRGQDTTRARPLWMGEKGQEPLGRKSSSGAGTSYAMLLVVLGLAGGAAWYLRRRKKSPVLDGAQIDVVASRAISNKHRLVLVEAAGELLLLGCTEKEIRLLQKADRRRFQQREEAAFFTEGLRMDAENRAGQQIPPEEQARPRSSAEEPVRPRSSAEDRPARPRSQAVEALDLSRTESPRFVDRLTQQIQSRQMKRVAEELEEPNPLDENWAAGIIRLRRAQRGNGAPPSETLH